MKGKSIEDKINIMFRSFDEVLTDTCVLSLDVQKVPLAFAVISTPCILTGTAIALTCKSVLALIDIYSA